MLLAAVASPRLSLAQEPTTLAPDARVLGSGDLRVRLLTSFTRWDELLGAGGTRNPAASFNADSLGPAQLPALSFAQTTIRTLSGLDNFRLTAGQLVSVGDSRVATAPLILEYGLTHRLTIGVVVPLVETRTTLYTQLNRRPGQANVGPNPAYAGGSAAAANAATLQQLTTAANALNARLTSCRGTPSDSTCTAILSDGPAALQLAGTFLSGITALYGNSARGGQPFVPIAGTPAQTAIDTQLQALESELAKLVPSSPVTGGVVAAGGPAANDQLDSLLVQLGRDTLQSPSRSSIGDISVGATFQLANSFPDSAHAAPAPLRYRVAVNGSFRFGTGEPAAPDRLFDVPTGYGQPGIEGGAAADLQVGTRWMLTALGSYTDQLGTIPVSRVANAANAVFPFDLPRAGTYSAGNVLRLTLVPRVRLAQLLSLNGTYSMVRIGADRYTVAPVEQPPAAALPPDYTPTPVAPYGAAAGTAQQLGFGFTYSTLMTDRTPGRVPFEVSFQHLETLSGSGGPVPKTVREMLELRVYLARHRVR